MSALPSQTAPAVKVGRDAGWILSFHGQTRQGVSNDPMFEVSRDDYYAEITATLPSGLEGGSYTFVIEGLTDDDYKQITQTQPDAPSVVRLYLYWRDLDIGDLGVISHVIGADFINGFQKTSKISKHARDLVAELRIVSVTRRAGARKYETTIVARELVFDLLQRRRPCGESIGFSDLRAATRELMRRAWPYSDGQVPYEFYAATPRATPASTETPSPDDAEQSADARQPIANALSTIAGRMESDANRYGRGMLLIRDGVLHVGQRPIPLDTDHPEPKALTLDQGLLEVETLQPVERDPNWDACEHNQEPSPQQAQYRLTLRGRGDIKPGDVVVFDAPAQESTSTKSPLGGAFGALGDLVAATIADFTGGGAMSNPVQLYVATVEHRLGRSVGFTTKVTGVQIGQSGGLDPDEVWDAHTPSPDERPSSTGGSAGTPEREAADAVVRLVRRELARLAGADVAEVRTFRATSSGASAGQTSDVFRGLTPLGGPNASRRADIKRPSDAPAAGVPYLTPFAWGRCGLVLPRYPGMRVALTHNHFDNGDALDVGALWQTGHLPNNAQAGDWWLSLPSEQPTGNAPGPNAAGPPDDYTGKTSHDLIDSAGNRVIEVGALVVRIGSDRLPAAGSRPSAPTANAVTIEYPGSGADDTWMIQIKGDGTVLLKGKNVTVSATEKLTLDAPTVEVTCDSMEVK